jgi:glutathione S-transferase
MATWLSVAEGKAASGLRLVLTAGVPGPWGESAKAIFHVKGLECPRIAQYGGQPNAELVAWTGESNAPQAIYADEPARNKWREIIELGERLAPDPPLIPDDPDSRALMFDLLHELAGDGGLGWTRRLMLFAPMMELPRDHPGRQSVTGMAKRYGYSSEAAKKAPGRAAKILDTMARQWSRQREANRPYLVGDRLSALDLYWAAFAALIEPLPDDVCPMPAGLRVAYGQGHPEMDAAVDPALLDHRLDIYEKWLELPIDLGPGFKP